MSFGTDDSYCKCHDVFTPEKSVSKFVAIHDLNCVHLRILRRPESVCRTSRDVSGENCDLQFFYR
jgi:hypothetical protein